MELLFLMSSPRMVALLLVFYQLVVGAKALLASGKRDGLPRRVLVAQMTQRVAPPDYQLGDENPYRIGVLVAVFINDSDAALTCEKRKTRNRYFLKGVWRREKLSNTHTLSRGYRGDATVLFTTCTVPYNNGVVPLFLLDDVAGRQE